MVSSGRGYRADIDGLRALAILAVVVFHAFPASLRGGFVGVDIFFVISGFLIGGGLVREFEETGTIHYGRFMLRRLRRLGPALLFMLLGVLSLGSLYLLADEFQALWQEARAGLLFTSNVLYWQQLGYFDRLAETKPLLHLWSLAVEEQFYLIFPLLMLLLSRGDRRLRTWLVLLLLSSWGLSLGLMGKDPSAAFYLLPARLWELLAGTLVALLRVKLAWRNLCSGIGFALILLALACTDRASFPGLWPLLPVLGTALVILGGPEAWINRRLLARPLPVALGLISYPLYLWHWPILAYAYILTGERPTNPLLVGSVLLALGLAIFSYRLVERWPKKLSMPLLALAVLILSLIPSPRGQPLNQEGDVGHEDFYAYVERHFLLCQDPVLRQQAELWQRHVRCFQSKPGAEPDIALLGDSHAEHLFLGMAESLPDHNIITLNRNGIPYERNPQFEAIIAYLLASPSIHTVVINLFLFENYLRRDPESFVRALAPTLTGLRDAGKRIILVTDTPAFGFDPVICKYARPFSRRDRSCWVEAKAWEADNRAYTVALKALAEQESFTMIETADLLKRGEKYAMALDGKLLFRDHNHLNIHGSRLVGGFVAKRLPL